MKVLLFGKDGQVGWELRRSLALVGEVHALGRDQAEFTKPQSLRAIIKDMQPDVVVNAVAYTAVDRAESEPDLAAEINAAAPAALAEATAALGALLVHYSTDYVFDGTKPQAYLESDATNPQNVYGRTKRDGEGAVRAAGGPHLVFRTCWVHAPRGKNFIRTILRLARERDQLDVVADQQGAPTGAETIADVTALAIRVWRDGALESGTYHLAASGGTTWHGLAQFVVRQAQAGGVALKLQPEAIAPIAASEYPVPAARPANSRLDCRKLEAALDIAMPDWTLQAHRTVVELLEGAGK